MFKYPGGVKVQFLFLFDITAACVVPCGGPKTSHRTSSIVHIIFLWSCDINEGILRNQEIIIGLDNFSNQRLIYLAPYY